MAIGEMTALACRAAVTTNAGLVRPEHYLAAIVDPDSNEPEKVVLENCGVTLDALMAVMSRSPIPGDTTSDGLKIGKLNPESLVLRGRAEGFAAAFGKKLSPRHYLLAFLWSNPPTEADALLDRLGTSRQAILDGLAAVEGDLPTGPMPPRRRWSEFRPLTRREFEKVAEALRKDGRLYRYGEKDDQFWISVSED